MNQQKPIAARSIALLSFVLWTLVPVPGASVLAVGSSAPASVVGFRGPGRDGVFPGSLPHRRPEVAWTFQTDGPVHGSPIWVDGLVVVGSVDGNLYAVDAASGAERWRFETGGAVDGPAAYVEGKVVVETRDGNLYAVDARTGTERWRVPLGSELPFPWGWDFYLSGPAVDGARLYVGRATARSWPWAPPPERSSGVTRREAGSAPRPRSPTGSCTWAASTATSTRSTPRGARSAGSSRRRARRSIRKRRASTGARSRARRPSRPTSSSWAAGTVSCTGSTVARGRSAGRSTTRSAGSWDLRRSGGALHRRVL